MSSQSGGGAEFHVKTSSVGSGSLTHLVPWLEHHSLAIFVALVMLGSLRIVCTYTVFSHTYDEPVHIASGMEWLSDGIYRYEPLHPPLARVATALGPFLDGGHSHGESGKWDEGMAILSADGRYDRTLALARLGILPFFWLACAVVYGWGRRYLGEPSTTLAILIFTSLPPVLAHAGLATTDMALTATVGASFLVGTVWCERPSMTNCLSFGGVTGLAVLSKFSAFAFLPVSFIAALVCYVLIERPGTGKLLDHARLRWGGFCLAAAAAFLVVWAGYRFSFGYVPFFPVRLPFPELYLGLQQLVEHERSGAGSAYLLGAHSSTGWWWYYLVVLGVKSPLAFLGLLALGLYSVVTRRASRGLWLALAFSSSILIFCLFTHINLGVRHILPVYIGLSIVAAAGATQLLNQTRRWRPAAWICAALLLLLAGTSVFTQPDYLAYFNILAGTHPEQILIDSDLDWGQDAKRLARRLREVDAKQLAFMPCLNTGELGALGLPPLTTTDFLNPSPGWNAIRLTVLELVLADKRAQHPELRLWPEVIKPNEKVGKGILLWYFPPEAVPPTPTISATRVNC